MTNLLCSVDDFLEAGGSVMSTLPNFLPQAESRILHLVVQSALREGLLQLSDLEGQNLSLWGELYGRGDRFVLREHGQGLGQTLEAVRSVAEIKHNQAWLAFCGEMRQAVINQAAAYHAATQRQAPESYLDFEAWTPEGHNLHPGAKTRLGFTASDHLAYAPELRFEVSLPWLAVSKSLLTASGVINPLFELDSSTWAVPVHPWQLSNILPLVYERELEAGLIRELGRESVLCRACTSLRTLVPEDQGIPVLKTSVGSLMTSTERSMSPYTVQQGPVYTEYLQRIFRWRPEYGNKVAALAETGGFSYSDRSSSQRARNFSLLFRERPPESGKGVPVPCSALPQPQPGHGKSYAAHFFGSKDKARQRFQAYLQLLVPFHLSLYLEYGIALEAHLQNCVVVWSSDGPEELWVRDWGGLRADSDKLKELAPDVWERLDPRSVTLSDAATAEKKLIACLYCNHLTEIVALLERECGVAAKDLWSDLAQVSEDSFAGHKDGTLYQRVMKEHWPVKCLLKMRLGIGGDGDVYQARANPLTF